MSTHPTAHAVALGSAAAAAPSLWAGVDAVIDRTSSLRDLRAHRLQLLAARRWRELGREVPSEIVEEEFRSACQFAASKALLRDAVAAYDGPLLVLKGPHTASFYPAPQLRPFSDVDVLAAEPEHAHSALLAAGFEPIGFDDDYYRGLHHLRPLLDTERGLAVEIHRHPNWFSWSDPPDRHELLATATSDVLGIPGLLGLAPEYHALVLAAHGWVELPFRRVSDLLDVAAVAACADPDAITLLSRRWQMERVWRTMIAAADAMFRGGEIPTAMRICAGNFLGVRDRTVQETHIRRLVASFWALPLPVALAEVAHAIALTALPSPSDTWSTKLARGRLALRHRSQPSSEHVELLGTDARRAPRLPRR
jgi:hypothetical protein